MTHPALSALAAIGLALLPGCSQASAPATESVAAQPTPAPAETRAAPPAPAPSGSRVLGKRDFALRGKPACDVSYVYAGHEADNLFWEEPCDAVTARMMKEQDLQAIGKWDRLDEPARKFVHALPAGEVLYVEGGFSASVYPIGTTGSAYEVPVAD